MHERLRAQLIRHEGRKLKPYPDPLHPELITIGVGRNLTANGISADECDLMLENDVAARYEALNAYPWFTALDEVRQAALVDMAFMGVAKLLGFRRMIAALTLGNWEQAALEMHDSNWAKQVQPERVQHLQAQMRTGQWQV